MNIQKKRRQFVSQNLNINSWEDISKYFEDLLNRSINSEEYFNKWLKDRSELEAVIEENSAWRYIKMTIDTTNEQYAKDYKIFVTEIEPHLAKYSDMLNKKMIETPFSEPTKKELSYKLYYRAIKDEVAIFRQENVEIKVEEADKSTEFGTISGQQTILHQGKQLTMQQASVLLQEQDENLRKNIFDKIAQRRNKDREKIDQLFDKLIELRHKIATNAGFDNFSDYQFVALKRFDYNKNDCKQFHKTIKTEIVPIVKELQKEKLKKLGKSKFKPWDLNIDPEGLPPLKPFSNGDELLQGTIQLLTKIDPYFGECIETMKQLGHLDLNSKNGKAPGGYNYPLYEIGVPFIFMNAVGMQRDLVTMVHEAGHAIHSFLTKDLELTAYKNVPSEVAELASMSMELITMNFWNQFYNDEDLIRAKKDQLESILSVLPWIAQIDEFQHWIYENPTHTAKQRTVKWMQLNKEYSNDLVDWNGYEHIQEISWQRQMHLFEVPFYYIEYGFAQLGAIGIWKNSISNFEQSIQKYKNALKLGYTQSIPKIYQEAGVAFNFSQEYISEIAVFVKKELNTLIK